MKGISGIYKDMDKPLLFSTIGLFIFGLFNIVTASSSEAVERYGVSIFYYFSNYGCYFFIQYINTSISNSLPQSKSHALRAYIKSKLH